MSEIIDAALVFIFCILLAMFFATFFASLKHFSEAYNQNTATYMKCMNICTEFQKGDKVLQDCDMFCLNENTR